MTSDLSNGIAALLAELKTIPDTLAEKARKILNYRKVVEDARTASKACEAKVSGDVASDAQFSNEIKRKAEISARLSADKEYQGVLAQIAQVEGEIALDEIEVERLERRFRALLAEKDLRVAVLGVTAGDRTVTAARIAAGLETN